MTHEAPIISIEDQRNLFAGLRLRQARIPAIFSENTIDGFQTDGVTARERITAKARSYVDGFGDVPEPGYPRGLILHGPTGSGKTHIMVSILRDLIERGQKGLFYNLPNLFMEIRGTFGGKAEQDEDDLMNDVINAGVLALDDVGAEKSSDWVLDRLYLIVNQRYEACRPTLITTNHDWPAGLGAVVGARITSRLAQMCKPMGPFPSGDWRLQSAGLEGNAVKP